MARLDKETQKELEPKRMEFAKQQITKLGYEIIQEDKTRLIFHFKERPVSFFPYSGWHTGKTIKDGRGLQNLLNQIK